MTRARRTKPPPTPSPAATQVAYLQLKLEEERARIARRLHSDVVGMLAAARMDLSRLAGMSEDRTAKEHVVRIDQVLEQVIQNARSEMQRLHPALLDHFGLGAALRHTVEERCRASGAEYTLDVPEVIEGIAAPVALATFRVIESLLGTSSIRRVGVRWRENGMGQQLGAEVEVGGVLDAATREDLQALRIWLETMGVTWNEARHGEIESVELTVPHASQRADTATAPGR